MIRRTTSNRNRGNIIRTYKKVKKNTQRDSAQKVTTPGYCSAMQLSKDSSRSDTPYFRIGHKASVIYNSSLASLRPSLPPSPSPLLA